MKILLISDLHGHIPCIKDSFDIILCAGDLCDSDDLRNFEFSHWDEFKEGKDFHDLMAKKEYIQMFKKSVNSADNVLKWLSSKAEKVFIASGNSDFDRKRVKELKYFSAEPLEEKAKKFENIFLLKCSSKIIENLQILGLSGYRGFSQKFPEKDEKLKAKKANLKWENNLIRLFKKKSKGKFCIFLAHDTPRGILDSIKNKSSPINGKNIGDEYYTKMLKKYSPDMMVCGHMHENQGKKYLSKTMVINCGYAKENHYAILELKDYKIKSLKFY